MKQDLLVLQANLEALDRAADNVAYHDLRGFFHRLLMKCASRISHEDFTEAIRAAEKRPA